MDAKHEIKIASNPVRCSHCGRFIPVGFAVLSIGPGMLRCLFHVYGTVSIDKGQAPWNETEQNVPTARRRFTRMEIV